MKFIALIVLATFAAVARAGTDLPTDFAQLMNRVKGPFDRNVLQGTATRMDVASGRVPAGFLFQAAYRSELAHGLITDHGFYLGNLFTTDYYELMGEYVYGDAAANHPLDHAALAEKSSAALGKASLIIRHWVLEKQYIEQFPDSRLARSFKIRGISSYETEVEYAKYFFNFYLGAMDDDFQYLPAFLLATQSPIVDSASLARARNLVGRAYDDVLSMVGAGDPMTVALYKIRNSIHNQLSPLVIGEIDRFLKRYPRYRALGYPERDDAVAAPNRRDLDEIRKILIEYYAFSATKLVKAAVAVGATDVKEAAGALVKGRPTGEGLWNLSTVAAAKREQLSARGNVAPEKRAETLALLVNVSRYLRKELSALKDPRTSPAVEAVLNLIYLEGFLIRDNWVYFKSEIAKSTDLAKTLTGVIEVASGSAVADAFAPAFEQWRAVEPKMQAFVDQTLKSSAIETAASIVPKLAVPARPAP